MDNCPWECNKNYYKDGDTCKKCPTSDAGAESIDKCYMAADKDTFCTGTGSNKSCFSLQDIGFPTGKSKLYYNGTIQ